MKKIIYKILCNNLTGHVILLAFGSKIPTIRSRGFRFYVDVRFVRREHIASIFWGFYESAEARLIDKHLIARHDVIELGASIGVVSSHIVKKLGRDSRFVSVEANCFLTNMLRENVSRHSTNEGLVQIENCAISYSAAGVSLQISGNNTESKTILNSAPRQDLVPVDTCSLGGIQAKFEIGKYILVCDIEGAEVGILMNDMTTLTDCLEMFIELHETEYEGHAYSILDLVKLIEDKHCFHYRRNIGPVYHFVKEP